MATPFKTMAEQAGDYRPIGFAMCEMRLELIYLEYFVSRPLAERNERVLERFLSAPRRSMRYGAEHEQKTRGAAGKLTGLPDERAQAIPS